MGKCKVLNVVMNVSLFTRYIRAMRIELLRCAKFTPEAFIFAIHFQIN